MEKIRSVSGDLNEMWHWWKTFFLDILNKHAPVAKIKVKGNHLPYMYVTSELKSMIRQRDYLRAKANKTGSNLLRQAYNHIKNRVNYKLFTFRKNYCSDKIEENKGNLKGTWKILRQAIGQGNKSVSIDKIVSNGSDISDSGDIVRVCNQHFISVGTRLAEKIPFTDESPTAHIKVANVKFQHRTIAASQIVKVIKKLNNKATGIHDIPNKILKDNVSILSPYLEEIFNFSIRTGVFPNELKIGKVTPIFKSGEKEDLNNYRPISVLPTIARVFEKLLYNQLYKFFTENQLLGDQQYGFRSLHSTALALGKCSNQWLMNIDNGKINSVIFLDIRKAFDTVNHEILLQKLSSYEIKGDTHKFFECYLKDRTQCCSVNGHMSSLETIEYGVPQGSILGPLLFLIYMNDLPLCLDNVDITMFADTNFMKAINSLKEIKEELVPALKKVYNWLRCNKLSLNTVKTEFMLIGTHQKLERFDHDPAATPYMISAGTDSEIKRVRIVKYLRLIVDDTLIWSDHAEYISTKIRRGIGILKRTSKFLKGSFLLMIYSSLIEPYLRYCNIVWGQCNETLKDKLQALQNKAARSIAKVKYEDADHHKLLGQFGWLSVQNVIKLDMGIFMCKCQNGSMPDSITRLYTTVDNVHSYHTRSIDMANLHIPRLVHSYAQSSLSYTGAKLQYRPFVT